MTDIPYRLYYSKSEAAQLTGQSVATINRRIREGLAKYPGPDAIRPEYTRAFGDQTKIHRAWITGEPLNLTPMRQRPLTTDEIEDAMRSALVRFASELIADFAAKRKGAA